MILSDFGADVTRFDDPDYASLNREPAARVWLRGKKQARQPLHEAARRADVIVITTPNGFPAADFETIHRLNPGLVYAEISAFGMDFSLPVSEPVVAARMGRMKSMEGILPEPGPRYAAVQVATHATAHNIVSGILACLHERAASGVGQRVSTSLAHGLIPYDQGASLAMQLRQKNAAPAPAIDPARIMPTLNYHPVQCADGKWLQLGNLLPHLFANFMRCIGLDEALIELLQNPEDANLRERVRDKILTTMQTRTSSEWMQRFIADDGIAAHPYQTCEQALGDPDMIENGHVICVDGVTQPGPFTRLCGTPAEVGQASTDGQTPGEKSAQPWDRPAINPVADTASPLHGVTVVEFATIIAAPLAASFLADLGARVIKVESVGGDPYRKMGGGVGAIRCNQGKESIGVDLKSDAGQAIAHKLVHGADIVIHNFRPGVPERLGIGYTQLKVIKPDLIYISANGYGTKGPSANRPSTHPIPGAAMGGALYQAGGAPSEILDLPALREYARRLMRANEVNPDPNTAVTICSSALLGLIARQRTGAGQQIFGDMFIANAWANFNDFFAFDGKPPRLSLDPALLGTGPLQHLYQCSDGWVFLGIERVRDWEAFCTITGEHHLMAHYPDPVTDPGRDLQAELSGLFASNTASHWESLLLPHGIGCVVADRHNLAEKFFDECRSDSDWMVEVHHPELGTYYRHTPMLAFSRSRSRARAGTPAGAHTRPLMAELGYSQAETDALFSQGILWSQG
jgi:crotonobetainyl-CoA:carnitine CoA-transferase CaiB-like acyl-CoA transferase